MVIDTYKKLKTQFFDWLKKSELIELNDVDIKKDPVRPELTMDFRTKYGRKVYGLKDEEGEIAAVMCFAFTNQVPTTVEELDKFSQDAYLQSHFKSGQVGQIAIAYTVWSTKKGGGRRIVQEVYKMIKKSHHLNRLVTLSPLTDMARNFHLKNGAKELQVNKETQNFEYEV